MSLRFLFAAAVALLLGGCTGWAAESRLIPVAKREAAGLMGTYTSEDDRAAFAPGENGFVRVIDPTGAHPGVDLAFAFLREEAATPSPVAEATVEESGEPDGNLPDRSYLMEIPWTSDDGKIGYVYGIVRISFSSDGTADTLTQFTVVCSKAAEKLAARKEFDQCIFDDYARLRVAAFDALSWHDVARMAVVETTFSRADLARSKATPISEP